MTEYTFYINGEYKTVEADTKEEAVKEDRGQREPATAASR